MATDPIVTAVQADLAARSERGIEKYGVTLAREDLTPAQWVQHGYEEAMDLALYLRRLRGEVERLQRITLAAAAWRAAAQAADDALEHAADVAQGIEHGDKKAAHHAATMAEDAALTARAAYDQAVKEAAHE